nr:MAG TPA: hypothetical protein [Caudoviricetes sp.]
MNYNAAHSKIRKQCSCKSSILIALHPLFLSPIIVKWHLRHPASHQCEHASTCLHQRMLRLVTVIHDNVNAYWQQARTECSGWNPSG